MPLDIIERRSHSVIPKIVESLSNDPKTGQLILFRTLFRGRNQTKSTDPAGFSDVKANQLLKLHLRRKSNYGFLYCLNDRIRFERRSHSKLFREQAFYKDIKFIYIFSNFPDVIMLTFMDEQNRQIYETYTVNSMEDRNKIIELTQMKNSFNKLRNPDSDNSLFNSDDNLVERYSQNKSNKQNQNECEQLNDCNKLLTYYNDNDNFSISNDKVSYVDYLKPAILKSYSFKKFSCNNNENDDNISHSKSPYTESKNNSRNYFNISPITDDYIVLRRPPNKESGNSLLNRHSVNSSSKYDLNRTSSNNHYNINLKAIPISSNMNTDKFKQKPFDLYVQRKTTTSSPNTVNNYSKSNSIGLSIYRS